MSAKHKVLHILNYKCSTMEDEKMSVEWHPDENALYEVDEECIQLKQDIKLRKEEPVLNYFTLLLCLYYV